MFLFKSKAEKELDELIKRINMNMSNNYKDAAQSNLSDFEAKLKTLEESGKLSESVKNKYEKILADYKERMKGYTHKDQKPYWT